MTDSSALVLSTFANKIKIFPYKPQTVTGEVRRVAENLPVRACVDMEGGYFKHVLKKYKNRATEE